MTIKRAQRRTGQVYSGATMYLCPEHFTAAQEHWASTMKTD